MCETLRHSCTANSSPAARYKLCGLEYAYFPAYSVCNRRRNKKVFLDLVKNTIYSFCPVSPIEMFNDAAVQYLDDSPSRI